MFFLCFQISAFSQLKRKYILDKFGTEFRSVKNGDFWKNCSQFRQISQNLDFCQNFICELIAENSVHTEISSEISSLQKSQKHTSENRLWFSIWKPIFIIMYAACNSPDFQPIIFDTVRNFCLKFSLEISTSNPQMTLKGSDTVFSTPMDKKCS